MCNDHVHHKETNVCKHCNEEKEITCFVSYLDKKIKDWCEECVKEYKERNHVVTLSRPVIDGKKVCIKCGSNKPISEFKEQRRICKECESFGNKKYYKYKRKHTKRRFEIEQAKEGYKICSKCDREKLLSEFRYFEKTGKYRANCKECDKAYQDKRHPEIWYEWKDDHLVCFQCKEQKHEGEFEYSDYFKRPSKICKACSGRLVGMEKHNERDDCFLIDGKKKCKDCRKIKELKEFECRTDTQSYRGRCRECENKRQFELGRRKTPNTIKRKEYVCDICGRSFNGIGVLANHVKKMHKDITSEQYYLKYINPSISANLKCPICGKRRHYWTMALGFFSTCCDLVCVGKLAALQREKGGYVHSEATRRLIGESHKGEKSVQWLGGPSDETSGERYGYGFTEKLKKSIRLRDDCTCQKCSKTQEEEGKKLAVHHIDYDKKNNEPTNLITLCCVCHAKTTHGKRNYWTKYCNELILKIYSGEGQVNDKQNRF